MIRRLLETLALGASSKWVVLSLAVGVVAGIGAILFQIAGQLIGHYAQYCVSGYAAPEAAGEHSLFYQPLSGFSPALVIAVLFVGGLVSGALVHYWAPEAAGHGTDAAIDAFHNQRGRIRARVPLIKGIASAVTLGTGGSGGREGPIAQIGAGFGSWLGAKFKLTARDRRIMLAAGMGAGVGAIFRAPLAGAIFAAEILYSEAELEGDVIVPSAVASIVAYSVFTQFLPANLRFVPLFGVGLNHAFLSPVELFPYAVLAVVLAVAGGAYVTTFYRTHALFERLPVSRLLRPALGAALAGVVAIVLWSVVDQTHAFAVLGTGYGTLQIAVSDCGSLSVMLLVAIAAGKVLTTSLTIGSGGSGGVFGPSMVIGGCLGAAIGLAFNEVWPGLVAEPEAFAVVGMAGFFAGVARAPISTIIMVRAMTGDFGLLVPTMLVCTLTFLACGRWRLYRKQVPTRLDSSAHRGDFLIDVLEGLKVKDVHRPEREILLTPEGKPLHEIVHNLTANHQHYFPVVDSEHRLVGIFTDDDVRGYLYDDTIWMLAVARDVMTTNFLSLSPDDDLNTALRKFTMLNLDELPIVGAEGRFLGMLRRKETIAAYNQRLMEHKQAIEDHS